MLQTLFISQGYNRYTMQHEAARHTQHKSLHWVQNMKRTSQWKPKSTFTVIYMNSVGHGDHTNMVCFCLKAKSKLRCHRRNIHLRRLKMAVQYKLGILTFISKDTSFAFRVVFFSTLIQFNLPHSCYLVYFNPVKYWLFLRMWLIVGNSVSHNWEKNKNGWEYKKKDYTF